MQLKQTILASTVAAILSVAPSMAAAENCSASLMTDEERAAHKAKMQSMSAEEWNRYRNEQYKVYLQRAQKIGCDIPATPPLADSRIIIT